MVAAGYTAGFLLAPRQPEVVTRIVPEKPAEAPQPFTPPEILDDA
jgi:hypothetical protein